MEAKKSKLPIVIISIVLSLLGLWIAYGVGVWIYAVNSLVSSLPEKREVGDFAVFFFDGRCDIFGTTEQGNSKKFLVIPEYIDGVPVYVLGDDVLFFGWFAPKIESETLEKVYFESAIKSYLDRESFSNSFNCPNLKKVMYPNVRDDRGRIANCDVYYPCGIYEQESEIEYYSNEHPANVSFYYNYADAKNSGYYWIDDCDYGGKIEYIPKAPTRDGYTFDGWYKEPECINEWDFDTDTLPEEKTEQKEVDKDGETVTEEVTVYQETILYAKWL